MWRLALLAFLSSAAAQIPSLGWCPEYQPMPNFDMKRFLGTWYEAERYFSVGDLISRCVTTKYESTPEGRILVSNEIINSLTGMKRVLDGHLSLIGREGEGRMTVKYASLPIPYESEFLMLDTDYDSFAVMWSCSGLGPLHTQNAWVLTRDRIANTATMQAAYGVLDRFKLSRTFFVKTNQGDCNILPEPVAKDQEGKSNVVVEQKSAVVPDVVEVSGKVVEQPIEKRVDSEVKPEVPEERSAVPVPAEPKPMQVPELILSESSEKKEEKKGKPEEKPFKEEKKEEFPVKAALPEKIENESKEKMGDKRE